MTSPVAAAPARQVNQTAQLEMWTGLQSFIDANTLGGLAGASFGPDGKTVTVFWAGSTPPALVNFAVQQHGGAVVEIKQVPYDQQQIGVRAKALIAKAKTRGIPIVSVASTANFAELHADVDPSATAEQRTQLRDLGAAEVGEKHPMVPLARYADSQPYWSGAVIERTSANAFCSTGFAARTSSNVVGMVTAQHCGTNVDWMTPTVVSSGGLAVGRSNGGNTATDSMLITGTTYSGFIYTGAWDSATGRGITATGTAALNQSLCAGGGMSGEVCQATVQSVNVFNAAGSGPGYEASTAPSTGLAGQGDSGGPGYARSQVTGNITLLGMIATAELVDRAACAGGSSNPWNGGSPARLCFSKVFFVNQNAIASALGVTILTSS
jgi:hypothetical protein